MLARNCDLVRLAIADSMAAARNAASLRRREINCPISAV
jgi:hypothetical protein